MPDAADLATAITDAATRRSIAATRALVSRAEPVRSMCEACCEDDVWVLPAGGLLRCVECRVKLEGRR